MPTPQTEVIVTKDGVELARRIVTPGAYLFGRGGDVDFSMETPLASRHHARLTVNLDEWLIEDLASANGTFINDQPVPPNKATRVFPTQTLRVGDATVTLRRLRDTDGLDDSVAPGVATLRAVLPEEIRKDRRYAIGKLVAQGGMGAILNAQDQTIHRGVAMKVMLQSGGSEDVLRFVEEAQITGQLEHPNIVPVYELGVDEQNQPFYTMKFVRGTSLRKILELIGSGVEATVKKYPLGALLTIFQKVCDGLAFAHAKGVIHRDLKPENIMIGEYGEALVMDWGLAKVLARSQESAGMSRQHTVYSARQEDAANATLAGSIMGTPQYMSPEQASGEIDRLDARTDIYALGAILYQLLTLQAPVMGKTVHEVLAQVRAGTIVPPLQRVGAKRLPHLPDGRVPESLAAVAMKALALSRSARYASVKELQADIEAYQTGFATKAESASAWKQLTLFLRRHKTASIGVAAVLVIGGVMGPKAILEGRRAEREAAISRRALADLKKSAPAMLQLAEAEAGFQRFESALEKCDAALALDPTLTAAYWPRAWSLIALERWPDAAAALTLARERDPAHAARADILPIIEQLAVAPAAARWTPERSTALYRHLSEQGATGALTALSRRFQLGAREKQKLVRQRIDQWLGKNVGRVEVRPDGSVAVGYLPKTTDNLEPLRGLPIGALDLSYTKVTSLEPLRAMPLTDLTVYGLAVRDLSPLRGMKLTRFAADASQVSDLSPLAGLPLTIIGLANSQVNDITALRGMPLQEARFGGCPISDYSPLQGAPLRNLYLGRGGSLDLKILAAAPLEVLGNARGKSITDLAPLRDKPLRTLDVSNNRITDLSALAGLPLVDLQIESNPIADYAPLLKITTLTRLSVSSSDMKHPTFATLRQHPALKSIALDFSDSYRPVAEFWKEFDAKKAAAPK
jgi:serine/threonine protein kinase